MQIMSSSGIRRCGLPAMRKFASVLPKTLSGKKIAQPAVNTAQVRSGLARASLSLEMAKATAIAAAIQMDQVVPCSLKDHKFAAAVSLKNEGASQKAVNP